MKKTYSIIIISIGVILIFMGLFKSVPSKQLTDSSILKDSVEYSYIKKYVGGDAYNYIIGSNLVGAEITGTIISKAIYLSSGSIILSLGLFSLLFKDKQTIDKQIEITKPDKEDEELLKF